MTKKHFIALADYVKDFNAKVGKNAQFSAYQIESLASFCAYQNPLFNRSRWLAYIKGECGKNGKEIKP